MQSMIITTNCVFESRLWRGVLCIIFCDNVCHWHSRKCGFKLICYNQTIVILVWNKFRPARDFILGNVNIISQVLFRCHIIIITKGTIDMTQRWPTYHMHISERTQNNTMFDGKLTKLLKPGTNIYTAISMFGRQLVLPNSPQ